MTAMANEVVLQWAGATDVGRVRSENQDRYLARPESGLWAVCDGMGGHQGGETAAQTACDEIGRVYGQSQPPPHTDDLVQAVSAANRAVHEKGNNDPDLTGMGTTVVALAVVTDDKGDELFALASVGDSRIYRMADGLFEQLTEDHSLVADMVREGSITPEDAASHPQRNILTRVLGVYEDVPVDVMTVIPRPGDRFVLCSDGLFNEVTDDGMTSVLRRLADPAEAADELVRLAVQGGGRDNVTVVIVDVLADGDRAQAASIALAGERNDTAQLTPYQGGAYAADALVDEEGVTTSIRRARLRRRQPGRDKDDRDRDYDADDGEPPRRAKPRRFTWRVLLFCVLILALFGGVFATINWYGTSAYFVGFDGDEVAIFKGRPGGVLWVDPELEHGTGLSRDELPEDALPALTSGKEASSLKAAEEYVDNLTDRVNDIKASTTTTTTAPTTTTRPGGTTSTTRR